MQRHDIRRFDEPAAPAVAAPPTNEVAELREEVAALRDEVHRVRAERDGRAGTVDAEPGWRAAPVGEAVSRRRLFGLLGGATAGAGLAVTGSTLGADRAHAADDDNLIIGQDNTNTTDSTRLTGSTSPIGSPMLEVTQNAATNNNQQAILGSAAGSAPNMAGVFGASTSSADSGFGVRGQRFAALNGGVGVQGGAGTTGGIGVQAFSTFGPALQISPTGGLSMPPDSGTWPNGSFVNTFGQLWYCYVTGEGSESQWVRLSSTFVPAPRPARVYDSRPGENPSGVEKGQLNPNQERVVDVALGGAVPTTASAVLCNLSVVSTVNAGFLAMFKDGITWPGHASVNWSASNQITGNNATSAVAVDGAAVNVRVRCGGSGGTHFVVDVLGHYA